MQLHTSVVMLGLLSRLASPTDDVSQPPGLSATAPAMAAAVAVAADCRDQTPTDWHGRIGAAQEPGERLTLSGRVLAADGTRPVAGATVYAYHTDASGYYSANQGMDNRHPRLCIVLKTDASGRYRIDTIRPAAYATGNGPPPHVHYEVWGEGLANRSFHLAFDVQRARGGDTEAARGTRGAETRPLYRDGDGVWHCVRDLRMN